ncbi:MAG: 4Fe-4S binding protein [Nitrososphaerota archaeon]|nr:4Fe-4S binding protein [Nitrososphaerota archaeon]
MNICVEINETLASRSEIEREILSKWPGVYVISGLDEELPQSTDGILVVGRGRNRDLSSLPLVENLNPDGLNSEQVIFQINANLGKMRASDLAKITKPKQFDKSAQLTRRDLFGGLRSPGNFLKTYSTSPVIYNSICEAKFGCSKCVAVCPTQALSVVNGAIYLKDDDCSRIGVCASVCPVAAIQLPRYSESQFLGLIGAISSTQPRLQKTLVITCDKTALKSESWTFFEEVKDVGVIGTRQIVLAIASGISRIIVYCADGRCLGKVAASQAVESVRTLVESTASESAPPVVRYFEGLSAGEELAKTFNIPSTQIPDFSYEVEMSSWGNYVAALNHIASPESKTVALGLIDIKVSDSCTLCQVCANYCPHSALQITAGSLQFDSSKCTGCGYCSRVCPEHSIAIGQPRRLTDLARHSVFRDEIVNCARCSQPIGSTKYLKNVRSRLGKEDPMMKYCNSCKQQIAVERMLGKKQ